MEMVYNIRYMLQSNFHLIPLNVESDRTIKTIATAIEEKEEKTANKNASKMIECD